MKIIYKSEYTSVDVTVSEGNKWYTYLLPKDKGLYNIEGDSVKKVVVKADISFYGDLMHGTFSMIPKTTIEASFKGSNTSMAHMFSQCNKITSLDLSNFNTSNVTDMSMMFNGCRSLTSLDLSGWDTSNVTNINMGMMFSGCSKLNTITMVGCSQETVETIRTQLTADGITGVTIVTE